MNIQKNLITMPATMTISGHQFCLRVVKNWETCLE